MDNTDDIWSLAPAKDCVFFVFFKKIILIEIDRYVVDFGVNVPNITPTIQSVRLSNTLRPLH